MNCKEAKKLMVDSIYGELPNELCDELNEHLLNCQHCSTYRVQLQRVVEYLNQVEQLQASVDMPSLHRNIERECIMKEVMTRLRKFTWASAFVGIVGFILLIFSLSGLKIQYEDKRLSIMFNRAPTVQNQTVRYEPNNEINLLSDKLAKALEDQRRERIRFEKEINERLDRSKAELLRLIYDHESAHNKQVEDALRKMQIQHYQSIVSISKALENLALQTENEFRRSYMTMAILSEMNRMSGNP